MRMLASGAALPEIMREAVKVLLAENGAADRAGVWMETKEARPGDDASPPMFRGVLAERNGDATPAEWETLSPEAPLVRELVSRGETAELQLNGTLDGRSMGALLEMRRMVCAPVQTDCRLRGIVVTAARDKKAALEKSLVEKVAVELAIVMEVQDERRRARERQEDVVSAGRMLATLGSSAPTSAVLAEVVDNCVKGPGSEFGLQAVFAAIGETQVRASEPAGNAEGIAGAASADGGVEFLWQAGDVAWTSALDREPLFSLWQRALETRRVKGGEAGAAGSREVARIVAFPLQGRGEMLGVLVAGLRHKDTSLATVERLELRAAIAAQALLTRKRFREAERRRNLESLLIEQSESALVLLEANGRIRKLSQAAQELLNGKNGTGKSDSGEQASLAELFQTHERSRVEAWLQGKAEGRGTEAREAEAPDCELVSGTRVRLEAIRTANGTISAVRLRPLEAKHEHATERRVEAELRSAIEWLEEGVVLFDERQQVRLMNSRFAQMAGLTPEESTGTQNLQGLVERMANQTAEPEKFASRWLAMAHGSESGVRDELQLLLPTPRVLERAGRPMLDSDGRWLGRVEIYRDLTAQRVFHNKLIQTEKLAALGKMVTNIAHELSNPLTSILGYAQRLLAHNGGKGPSPEALQILHEAERASTILRQLLLTARNSRLERRKVLLNQIVMRTLELQDPSLRAGKVQVEVDLDPGLPLVLGEAGQLQQVLMNLLGNARQAIETGGKPGTIRIRTRGVGGTHALLEVSDDGPGIPQAILAKIFDPFFTTKPAGTGTGLGLWIVLGIVREHGGQVHVSSPPGGGATFSIELPAVPSAERQLVFAPGDQQPENEDQAGREAAMLVREAGETALTPWADSRVLIVEDEATVAQLIADVLKDEGFGVDVLLDGREALRRAVTEEYDLVVCDMRMPDLDGEEFYRRLVKMESPLSQRILFVTGDVLAARTQQFLQRNGLAHLAKPFRVEELTETVRQVLLEIKPRTAQAAKTKVARN